MLGSAESTIPCAMPLKVIDIQSRQQYTNVANCVLNQFESCGAAKMSSIGKHN